MREPGELIGSSAAMAAVRGQVKRLVGRPSSGARLPAILMQGETGVGKGLLARAIHHASTRRQGPWVEVNCAAIPESLVEAELFGVERGAFTDARQSKPGLFQAADRGALFLDEVGTLSLTTQAKLLTALEQRQVRRLGSSRPEPVDVWILSASNDDLPEAVQQKRFRADLYHRLAAVTLRLPPLRERSGDVLELAEHYLTAACADYGLPPMRLTSGAQAALLAYAWPGNVRELANLMERVALLTDETDVTPELLDLPVSVGPRREMSRRGPGESVATEREAVLAALLATRWNLSRAAAQLGVPRNTLRYRIEKLGLHPELKTPGQPAAGEAPAAATGAETAPRPPLRWERRWVTALRVALEPPADMGTFQLAPTLEGLVDKLRPFGAHIEELHPRGLLAFFGLEPAEDAPSRAVHAAWAAQKTVDRVHPGVGVTCAIHARECLIGRGSTVTGFDATDKQQLTARLDTLVTGAVPPGLVVSAETASFLERRFELAPIDIPAPDSDPAAYRVVGRGRSGFEVGGVARSPLVGRDRELAILDDLLLQVEQGHGQVVGLLGEPGVGKSRLLYEFRQSLGRDRVTYLESRCVSYGDTTPYLPILDLVRQLFGIAEADTPEVVGGKIDEGLRALRLDAPALLPYLLDLLGFKEAPGWPLGALPPEVIKTRTIDAVRQLAVAASQQRPVVIAMEDLQWIDQTSEETLAVLVESLAAYRILLLCTYRLGYQPRWLGKSYAARGACLTMRASPSFAPCPGGGPCPRP